MTSFRFAALLLLALANGVTADANSMRGGGVFVRSESHYTNTNSNSSFEDEYLQKEMYWGMKEMNRYNALRGSWPVRESAPEPQNAPLASDVGCA